MRKIREPDQQNGSIGAQTRRRRAQISKMEHRGVPSYSKMEHRGVAAQWRRRAQNSIG